MTRERQQGQLGGWFQFRRADQSPSGKFRSSCFSLDFRYGFLMTGRAGDLSPRQRTALEAILAGGTYAAASSAAGVTERTLFAWRRQPSFLRLLREGQNEIFASSRGELRAAAGDAVKALREIINQESAPASARVRAALGTLEYLHRTVELEEMEARMVEVEAMLAECGDLLGGLCPTGMPGAKLQSGISARESARPTGAPREEQTA